MNMTTKQEIFSTHYPAYRRGNKQEKGLILDAVTAVTGLHRKAVIRRFTALRYGRKPSSRGGRPKIYGHEVTTALTDLWNLSGNVCAERLHPQIPEYVRLLRAARDWSHTANVTQRLLAMSLGTMKDRLGTLTRTHRGSRGRGTTVSSPVKELVPIRTAPWDHPAPGFGEVDTVAHCGQTLRGDYAYSVQYTDVTVIWTLLSAQWNKGMVATRESLKRMQANCPFPFRGLDFDSGSEFINYEVVPWCQTQEPPIVVSRTRPYRKNDHGRIEQKNYANLRRWIGYHRYDQPEQVRLLNELYAVLEDFLNFFVPSVRCRGKERTGNHIFRRYDTAKTAYQRVLECSDIDELIKERLRQKYATLNLRQLKAEVERRQKRLIDSLR